MRVDDHITMPCPLGRCAVPHRARVTIGTASDNDVFWAALISGDRPHRRRQVRLHLHDEGVAWLRGWVRRPRLVRALLAAYALST